MSSTALVSTRPAPRGFFTPTHLREIERARRVFAELSDIPSWIEWELEIVICAVCHELVTRGSCFESDDERSECNSCADAR